eukprot:Sspe_Gene.105417::Locus_82453_Transcript_1_1_Confidence_1.000_Length_661::g.105417::m.105417
MQPNYLHMWKTASDACTIEIGSLRDIARSFAVYIGLHKMMQTLGLVRGSCGYEIATELSLSVNGLPRNIGPVRTSCLKELSEMELTGHAPLRAAAKTLTTFLQGLGDFSVFILHSLAAKIFRETENYVPQLCAVVCVYVCVCVL